MSEPVTPEDLSHSMLIAVLMDMGGSYTMPAASFTPDALGTPDGVLHAVQMEPIEGGMMRISVVARPNDMRAGGIRIS